MAVISGGSTTRAIRQFVAAIVAMSPRLAITTVLLTFAVGLVEGFGLLVLIPLLQLVGMDAQQGSLGRVMQLFRAVFASVGLLEMHGPQLGHPHSSGIASSRHSRMRELRAQHRGRPLRVLYAFDPRRAAILLIGGDKTGNDRWYEEFVPRADRLYDEHLAELKREGLIDDG